MKKSTFPIPAPKNTLRASAKRLAGWTGISLFAVATMLQPAMMSQASAQKARNFIKITAENAGSPKMVHLGLNKSLVVDLPADANDVLVANPEVADAVMRTSRRIYLFGKEIGQTNIFVFDGAGKQIAALEITIERDIAGLEDTLNRLIERADIKAEMINDNIVLTGTVATPTDASKAVSLAQVFVSGGEQSGSGGGASQATGDLASLFGAIQPESQIVNLLKIQGEDQVQLKVSIIELQRSVTKQLGLTTSVTNPTDDGFGFSLLEGGVAQNVIGPGNSASLGIAHGLNSISAQLQALEVAGVMRMLAEPTLSAISGETAEFKVGGQWQVPRQASRQTDGSVTISYEAMPYGVYLSFRPVVLTEGRISLKLVTEVLEPSPQGSTTFDRRIALYGVRSRKASTTVELPSGGSMAIAGLVQDDIRQVISGNPAFSKIPIFGTLFRSREFVRQESELVIIVTPYLVRPTARKNLTTPDEGFQPASDSAGYFMGRVNRVYGTKQGNLPKGRYTGSIGFILK